MPEKLKRALSFVPILAMIGMVIPGAGTQTQRAPDAREEPTPLIQSVKGSDLFRAYCASCHGMDAKGRGPAAPALKARVPDLTLLSRRNLGQFPAAHVREVIIGEQVVAAHGSREMPMWGPVFHQVEGDQDWGNVRLENLVKYLASIQSVQVAYSSSGVERCKVHYPSLMLLNLARRSPKIALSDPRVDHAATCPTCTNRLLDSHARGARGA